MLFTPRFGQGFGTDIAVRERGDDQQGSGEVVSGEVDGEGHHLDDAERVAGERADHGDDDADGYAGDDGGSFPCDERHRDEERGDGVAGDGVEPGGQEADERYKGRLSWRSFAFFRDASDSG